MSNIDNFLNKAIKTLLVTLISVMLTIGFLFITPVSVHAYSLSDLVSMGFDMSAPTGGSATSGSLTFSSGGQFSFTHSNMTPSSISFDLGIASIDSNRRIDVTCNTGFSNYTSVSSSNTSDFTVYNNRAIRSTIGGEAYTHCEFTFPDDVNLSTTQINFRLTDTSYSTAKSGSCVLYVTNISVNGVSSDIADKGQKEFDIPPGYAYYILTNGGSAVLTTKFSVYNNFFTGTWTGANQRIGISETRVPSSGYTFGSNTGSLIPWSKLSTADSNIIGQTYYAQFIYTDCPDNGNYLVIYNPVYAYDDDVTSNENSTIHVVISNFVGANRFALRSSLTWNGNVDSVSPDDYSDFESTGTGDLVVGDDTSLVWYPATSEGVDSSNGSTAPAPSSPYNDINSVADNNTFLGNLVERIIGFLEAPVSHIKSLFNAGVAFFAQLALLWSWLPPEVVTIISSALIVLLVIGVIKFLWK